CAPRRAGALEPGQRHPAHPCRREQRGAEATARFSVAAAVALHAADGQPLIPRVPTSHGKDVPVKTGAYILGISRHHDSAAALLNDGQIVALAEEERFNRKKHFGGFPARAIQYCLDEAGISLGDIDHVAYFWERWPELVHGLKHFVRYAPGTFAALDGALPG